MTTFVFNNGDDGTIGAPEVDTITSFVVGRGGDVLDLSDLLQGRDLNTIEKLDAYIHFEKNKHDTLISIDKMGRGF